jgi:hypothetical protein
LPNFTRRPEGVRLSLLEQARGGFGIANNTISNLEVSPANLSQSVIISGECWEASKMYLEEAHQKVHCLEASINQFEMDKSALTEKAQELSKRLSTATTKRVTEPPFE